MEATGFASVLPWQGLLDASCCKLPRLQAALVRPESGGSTGRKRKEHYKLVRRGKDWGPGTEGICTFCHLLDTRQVL